MLICEHAFVYTSLLYHYSHLYPNMHTLYVIPNCEWFFVWKIGPVHKHLMVVYHNCTIRITPLGYLPLLEGPVQKICKNNNISKFEILYLKTCISILYIYIRIWSYMYMFICKNIMASIYPLLRHSYGKWMKMNHLVRWSTSQFAFVYF